MLSWIQKRPFCLPVIAAALAALALAVRWGGGIRPQEHPLRVPGTDRLAGSTNTAATPESVGRLVPGPGLAATNLPGSWPAFRGARGDAISTDPTPLSRDWSASAPRELWSADLGEGYAGAAIQDGRVYVFDYDQGKKESVMRCLSLADGREIWRYAYPQSIKRNHGMTRTVPSVAGGRVVGVDPKCNVLCLDAVTGERQWSIDLVRDHDATIPPWYAGQCPLIDGDRVILAPGGRDALMMAVSLKTGEILWKTPNPRGWKMTHCSIVPMELGGKRFYVYCGSGGVAGAAAADGALLWDTDQWKISIATVPSPVVIEGGRIFLSGGYDAGSMMLQLRETDGRMRAETLFRLEPKVFGATQQTPIVHDGHIFGVRPDGQFVCLDYSGKVVWASGTANQYALGPYMLAGGCFYVMNDNGRLSLIAARSDKFELLGQAQVLKGRESWGPPAIAGGRMIARDLTRMICLDVSAR